MNQEPPDVSIVVPCYNEREHIEACMRSILAQELPPGSFELIVADGMSNDGTREILKSLAQADSRLRIVDNPGRTVPTGLNVAIQAARGKILVRMDAHTEYLRDYVRQCVTVLQERKVDNAGGPARTKAKGYIQCAIRAAYHSVFAVGGARFHDVNYEGYVDTVTYGCWPREVFNRIGLFDEKLVGGEDDEFNLRLLRAGGKIWQSPTIESFYWPRSSLRALFKQYMQYGNCKVLILQKHKTPASMRHLVPGFFLLSLVMLTLLAPWFPLAFWSLLGLVSTYSVATVTASFDSAARYGWRLLPVLPLVFACYHFAYGYGFLRGVWRFAILRREPSFLCSDLTPAPGKQPPPAG